MDFDMVKDQYRIRETSKYPSRVEGVKTLRVTGPGCNGVYMYSVNLEREVCARARSFIEREATHCLDIVRVKWTMFGGHAERSAFRWASSDHIFPVTGIVEALGRKWLVRATNERDRQLVIKPYYGRREEGRI